MKKIISLQISVDLYEKLRKAAYEKHMTISKLIREVLKENILKDEKKS